MTARYKASNRTLIFVLLAVLANAAVNQFWGSWASPWRQATVLLLLTAIVQGLQLGWAGAEDSPGGGVRRSDRLVIGASLVLIVELIGGRRAAFPELIPWLAVPIMLLAPTIGALARRSRDRRASRGDQDEQ